MDVADSHPVDSQLVYKKRARSEISAKPSPAPKTVTEDIVTSSSKAGLFCICPDDRNGVE
jgi:hypothetical protein